MREAKGSFTVEATILVPFLIAVCVVFVYLGIYAYDKTLMIQDVNGIAAMIRDENSGGGKDITALCEGAFSEIKKEHPYLSLDNLKLDVSAKGSKVCLRLSADWQFPLYRGYSRELCVEREVKRINPIEKMYLTDIVRKSIQGERDDDTVGVRD